MPIHSRIRTQKRRERDRQTAPGAEGAVDVETSGKLPREQLIEDLALLVVRAHRARQHGGT